ncbi:MAG: hypothetical protein HYW02_06795 [Deltaproteobacteria bacterium]|nr:hypothetical protein [Deltaproteobacteria bacterium]MBI4196404.1 hypothetical protein [Deltaproteobacteria bacterium]
MPSQCPKCHEVLDEDYVCCAGVEFQWRCKDCCKRSRGFAIPFGQCELCGGSLEKICEESPSDARIAILQEAFQIEVGSSLFYQRLAEAVDDPESADFFEEMAEMEREHASELSKKYHLHLGDRVFQDTGRPLPYPFFEDLCFFNESGEIRRLFDCAIRLEKKTLTFFENKVPLIPEGRERELYQELAAEEREHIVLLESRRDRTGGVL